MERTIEMQSRMKSPIFWFGLIACVYEAVLNSLASSGIVLHPVWSAIGVGLAALLVYCNGNNPSLNVY